MMLQGREPQEHNNYTGNWGQAEIQNYISLIAPSYLVAHSVLIYSNLTIKTSSYLHMILSKLIIYLMKADRETRKKS